MVEKLVESIEDNLKHGILTKYLKDINKEPILTPEEEKELIIKIAQGDQKAREKLLKTHLKFVVSIAKKFTGYGIPLTDLISEGNIGLIKAVEKFDPEKGVRFSTYASWWIKQSIKRAILNNSKVIRIPIHAIDLLRSFVRNLNNGTNNVEDRNNAAKEVGVGLRKLENLMLVSQDVLSYNQTINDNNSYTFEDVAISHDETPYNSYEKKEILETILTWLSYLNEKERTVIILRFGLINEQPMTLDEVGKILSLTKERIRQIEEKALNKLKFYLKSRKKVTKEHVWKD
jgi:RNA polymerase sigma factor (sigma-70 family)